MSTDAKAPPVPEDGPVGLNSPPESNSALRDASSDSELSDLEPEPDTTPPLVIEPDHISDGGVPVFKPNMEQFADFQRYINAVNPWGMKSGIVKVIPPAEWVAAQPPLGEAIKTIQIKNPIMQDIAGSNGTYRQANMEKGRSYNLPQWRELCEKSEHQPPAKRGERRVNQAQPSKAPTKSKASASTTKATAAKRKSGRATKNKPAGKESGTSTPDRLPTPVSPSMNDEDNEIVKLEEGEPAPFRRMGGRQPKAISVSARRKNNQAQAAQVDEAAFEGFKYELDDKFTQERCDELERQYWRTLTYASPLYGGDMPGTLFDNRTETWNLSNLPNLLNVLGQKIPGVNTAYLYLGMWKATFAWHLEDVDLYSINYLHFGAPKQWYSISQGDARRFEKAMASIWPIEARKCDQFLRHKTYLISPSTLQSQYNIKANKIVHHPGEFIITFPYGYHSGYNLGYNCAEAVNFAVESWLEHARVAKRCDCSDADDSVWVDYREIERKLRGEDTDFEETDDDEDDEEEEDDIEVENSGLPSPPDSNGDSKPKIQQKKRKRPSSDKGNKPNVKKIRIRLKAPSREPCILCPNDIPSEPLLETEDGQKVHKICAQYIPETRIEPGEKEVVMDLEHIPKARHDLKCNFCRSKKGACFQCSHKKCARAYHATCAAAAGVFVEQGEVPHFGEDGTEYKKSDFGFSCRFHRAKRDKKLDADALGDDERILKAASELKVGTICQLQFYRGDIFAGVVVENRRGEQTLLIDVVPRGERVEIEYKWLLLPDASDYHLPKASASAIAMPKSFKDREMLKTTERLADDLPRADDPFVKGATWAEFKCESIPRNLAQVKVDLQKDDQLWYYLGKTSTEAKAQFTEDPAKPRHNLKGHFLDTIPKPMPTVPRQSYAATYPSGLSQVHTALNNSRPAIRPPQPSYTQNLSKTDKPYQYKPRNSSGEAYRVDLQAFRSQHNFVQQSTQKSSSATPAASASYGLKFNTDPKFQVVPHSVPQPKSQAAAHPPNLYSNHSTNHTPTMGPLAPPATYRPPQPASAPSRASSTSTPHNIFGVKNMSKLSPFAKYAYLQKEHNRSPLEYKSPYRPGGGFMNGYQGSKEDLMAAYRKQIFGSSSGRPSNTPILPPARNHVPTPVQGSSSGYSSTLTSGPSFPPSVAPAFTSKSNPTPAPPNPTAWQKKESGNLHPAIRPEYGMFHNQYQPPQSSSMPQYQGQAMQPPATYARQSFQSQPPSQSMYQAGPSTLPPGQTLYQMSQPTQVQPPQRIPSLQTGPIEQGGAASHSPHTQPQITQKAMDRPNSQHGNVASPNGFTQFTNLSQYKAHQYTVAPQQAGPSAFAPQYYQPVSVQSGISDPLAASSSTPQQQLIPTPPKTPATAQSATVYIQTEAQQSKYQESKMVYPHQQNMENWNTTPQSSPLPQNAPARDFPDVPADSTSLIERVMSNLRKASSAQMLPANIN